MAFESTSTFTQFSTKVYQLRSENSIASYMNYIDCFAFGFIMIFDMHGLEVVNEY